MNKTTKAATRHGLIFDNSYCTVTPLHDFVHFDGERTLYPFMCMRDVNKFRLMFVIYRNKKE